MADYYQLLGGIVLALFALYYYFTLNFNFWKYRNIPGPQPTIGFGNTKNVFFKKIQIGEYLRELYDEYKNEPMIGMFMSRKPVLVLCDMNLIKDVLIKDFSCFDDRGLTVFEKADPLSQNILNFEARRWRPLRAKLSPVFTSGKLKEMFPLILECSEKLVEYLENVAANDDAVEIREITAKYTTDVIGSCAFGINMNALSDEESVFRRIGRTAFSTDRMELIRLTLRENAPWLYGLFSYVWPRSNVFPFFTKIISETMQYRERNNIYRPDFVNTLMELKKNSDKIQNIEITDDIVNAQAIIFFAAGFETSSTTISHALYEMALNPDIQDKLRQEIKEYHVKTDGKFKSDDVNEMKYLNKVFKETLRKYPPATTLRRRCNKDYTFNGIKVSIPEDTMVLIPVYAIHYDSNYYPNPETFDPERFDDEAVSARHSMTYLPFGDGPRNCIGERFAVYQTKVGIIKMLKDFRVDVCEKTIIPYKADPKALVLNPLGGLYLKISKVKN